LLKPEAIKRELVGEIITRLEKKFTIVAMKMITATKEEAEKHYHDKKDEDSFQEVVDCICAGPIILLCMEGEYAILSARNLIGATWPYNAHPSTIREHMLVISLTISYMALWIKNLQTTNADFGFLNCLHKSINTTW